MFDCIISQFNNYLPNATFILTLRSVVAGCVECEINANILYYCITGKKLHNNKQFQETTVKPITVTL